MTSMTYTCKPWVDLLWFSKKWRGTLYDYMISTLLYKMVMFAKPFSKRSIDPAHAVYNPHGQSNANAGQICMSYKGVCDTGKYL